ncbi:hypothetical protein [Chenggangzhangella methanolivorans]|nr:hypothetical protein [Chenggangzhangella methanolivorans]
MTGHAYDPPDAREQRAASAEPAEIREPDRAGAAADAGAARTPRT